MAFAQKSDDPQTRGEWKEEKLPGAYFAPRPAFGKRVSMRLGGRSW